MDADQQTANLRRRLRALVERANAGQLNAMADALDVLTEQAAAAVVARAEGWSLPADMEAVSTDGPGGGLVIRPAPDPIATARAVAEQAHYALTHRDDPDLRVDIPASYVGKGHHGIRTGTLVEERDGVCQVLVAGHGVVVVPSKDVGR